MSCYKLENPLNETMLQIRIRDIKIPKLFLESPPREEKIYTHTEYFEENNRFKKTSVVTQGNILIDGYCNYLIAIKKGIETMDCLLNVDRLRFLEKRRGIVKKSKKRKMLFKMQNGKCAHCGGRLHIDRNGDISTYMTLDHILPVCRGGSNGLKNLQGLCFSCNQKKNDGLPDRLYWYGVAITTLEC